MKRYATVTYNKYASFTNYGSALQTWALKQAILAASPMDTEVVCLDYCPASHLGATPLDPVSRMWDSDAESRRMVELSMPAIRINYDKFDRFYNKRCNFSENAYTPETIGDSLQVEGIDGYVCGSDTIFCIREFHGFDTGFFADAPEMRGHAVAYGASFGDVDWTYEELGTLKEKLGNFSALGLREGEMLGFAKEHLSVPVARTADPTLLLEKDDYLAIAAEKQHESPFLLYYSRRYDPAMERYTENIAGEMGLDIVEISLRATNASVGHEMRYDAGVEEYLALVRDASYMVTNSYHGLAFALQMNTPFTVFTREQAGSKISELLGWLSLGSRCMVPGGHVVEPQMSFDVANRRLSAIRAESLAFLREEMGLLDRLS